MTCVLFDEEEIKVLEKEALQDGRLGVWSGAPVSCSTWGGAEMRDTFAPLGWHGMRQYVPALDRRSISTHGGCRVSLGCMCSGSSSLVSSMQIRSAIARREGT
jgi:hypothetical protein